MVSFCSRYNVHTLIEPNNCFILSQKEEFLNKMNLVLEKSADIKAVHFAKK